MGQGHLKWAWFFQFSLCKVRGHPSPSNRNAPDPIELINTNVIFIDRKTICMQGSDLKDRDFVLSGSEEEVEGSPTFTEFSPGDAETSEYSRITTL